MEIPHSCETSITIYLRDGYHSPVDGNLKMRVSRS
jgi:hypothetical protein